MADGKCLPVRAKVAQLNSEYEVPQPARIRPGACGLPVIYQDTCAYPEIRFLLVPVGTLNVYCLKSRKGGRQLAGSVVTLHQGYRNTSVPSYTKRTGSVSHQGAS